MSTQRVALITGASRGIGKAIALALAKDGWEIGLNYRSNTSAAEQTRDEIRKLDRRCELLQADLSDTSQCRRLLQQHLALFGRVDVLVNNAAVAPLHRLDILQTSQESFDLVFATNVRGAFFLTQAVAKQMIQQRQREPHSPLRIINISSVSAFTVSRNRSEYCMAKAALSMMTRLFAERLAEYEVTVNEIVPGIIATDMTEPVREVYEKRIRQGLVPMKRWGAPEDVARAVAAIVRGEFDFTTGSSFVVNGGLHIQRL